MSQLVDNSQMTLHLFRRRRAVYRVVIRNDVCMITWRRLHTVRALWWQTWMLYPCGVRGMSRHPEWVLSLV